jgi:hypothetical protein
MKDNDVGIYNILILTSDIKETAATPASPSFIVK